eukprot:4309216-Pleurochrysis_carterae.AAC.7
MAVHHRYGMVIAIHPYRAYGQMYQMLIVYLIPALSTLPRHAQRTSRRHGLSSALRDGDGTARFSPLTCRRRRPPKLHIEAEIRAASCHRVCDLTPGHMREFSFSDLRGTGNIIDTKWHTDAASPHETLLS